MVPRNTRNIFFCRVIILAIESFHATIAGRIHQDNSETVMSSSVAWLSQTLITDTNR